MIHEILNAYYVWAAGEQFLSCPFRVPVPNRDLGCSPAAHRRPPVSKTRSTGGDAQTRAWLRSPRSSACRNSHHPLGTYKGVPGKAHYLRRDRKHPTPSRRGGPSASAWPACSLLREDEPWHGVEEPRNPSVASKPEACAHLSWRSQEKQLQLVLEVCPENGTKNIQLLLLRST